MHSYTIEYVAVSVLLLSTVIYLKVNLDDESSRKMACFCVTSLI